MQQEDEAIEEDSRRRYALIKAQQQKTEPVYGGTHFRPKLEYSASNYDEGSMMDNDSVPISDIFASGAAMAPSGAHASQAFVKARTQSAQTQRAGMVSAQTQRSAMATIKHYDPQTWTDQLRRSMDDSTILVILLKDQLKITPQSSYRIQDAWSLIESFITTLSGETRWTITALAHIEKLLERLYKTQAMEEGYNIKSIEQKLRAETDPENRFQMMLSEMKKEDKHKPHRNLRDEHKKDRPQCTKCKRYGHLEEKCWGKNKENRPENDKGEKH
jgi:hypothetical protein